VKLVGVGRKKEPINVGFLCPSQSIVLHEVWGTSQWWDPLLSFPLHTKYLFLEGDGVIFSPSQITHNNCMCLAGESGANYLALLPTLLIDESQYKCLHCGHWIPTSHLSSSTITTHARHLTFDGRQWSRLLWLANYFLMPLSLLNAMVHIPGLIPQGQLSLCYFVDVDCPLTTWSTPTYLANVIQYVIR